MWKKFKEWADIHGPIYQTSMAGQNFVIVSDETIAEELLIKRGHIYSGRPQIRALFGHKTGIGYLALMDRTGEPIACPSIKFQQYSLPHLRSLDQAAQMGSRCHGRRSQAPLLRAH